MIQHDKLWVRLAIALHDQLQAGLDRTDPVTLPVSAWQRCQAMQRQMHLAHQRGWHRTSSRMRRDLRLAVSQLQAELTNADRSLLDTHLPTMVQAPRGIYHDLIAIREEFDNVYYDRRDGFVSATTEPIELEDIYLGEFEIRLDLNNLSTGRPLHYKVIALDPHPSASNDCVTHPHVQDESLCEGEGQQAIRRALQQGRLLDFFVIVANLLRTYNSGSPYVSLAAWNGIECSDCGTSMSDEQHTCQKCDSDLCGSCHYSCSACDYSFCSACVTRCEDCDQFHCDACLKPCARCQTETCRACLDENERCGDCHDQENEEYENEPTNERESAGTFPDIAEIQPHRVGEAAIPA